MPLKVEQVEDPTLNLNPLIDIVFVLIIFFRVGTRFSELEREFDVKLPKVSTVDPITGRPDELVINVRGNGEIILNGERLALEELEEQLVAAREGYADQAVVVRGEGKGRYQAVVDVLAACNRAEIGFVSLAYEMVSGEIQ